MEDETDNVVPPRDVPLPDEQEAEDESTENKEHQRRTNQTTAPFESQETKGSHVSFGSVNVHKHRMTLGVNPSAHGIPVELAWEEHSSELFDDVEKFEDSTTHELHRIAAVSRKKIAENHHSRDSITKSQSEVEKIKRSIAKSENDPIDCIGDDKRRFCLFCCCVRRQK